MKCIIRCGLLQLEMNNASEPPQLALNSVVLLVWDQSSAPIYQNVVNTHYFLGGHSQTGCHTWVSDIWQIHWSVFHVIVFPKQRMLSG